MVPKWPFLLSFLLILACQKKYKRYFITELTHSEVITDLPSAYQNRPCQDKLNYAPDLRHPEHSPIKYVRVNFHVMCDANGGGNFDEPTGRLFINQVLTAANDKLTRNKKMNLPPGNDTPVLPMQYRYVLTPDPSIPGDDGIYFHYDDSNYYMLAGGPNQNNFSHDVYKKYGVQKDSVLNVFVMGAHVDSLKRSGYRPGSKGVGFGSWAKVSGWHFNVQDTIVSKGKRKPRKGKWNAQKLLHHEIGHCLGLRHTWRSNDGCDDTPRHSNCWNKTKHAPCDTFWSNNFMDYNAHGSAWSPCQIATIHYNFQNKRATRKLLEPRWCKLDTSKTIHIKDTVNWLAAKDLEGHLVLEEGAALHLYCKLSMPAGAKISIYPDAQLLLHDAELYNDCGELWEGIELLKRGQSKGEILLTGNSKIRNTKHPIQILPPEVEKE